MRPPTDQGVGEAGTEPPEHPESSARGSSERDLTRRVAGRTARAEGSLEQGRECERVHRLWRRLRSARAEASPRRGVCIAGFPEDARGCLARLPDGQRMASTRSRRTPRPRFVHPAEVVTRARRTGRLHGPGPVPRQTSAGRAGSEKIRLRTASQGTERSHRGAPPLPNTRAGEKCRVGGLGHAVGTRFRAHIVTCFLRYDPPQNRTDASHARTGGIATPAVLVRAASCRSARLPVRCSRLGQPGNGLLKVLDRRPHLDRRSRLASRPGRVTPARHSAAPQRSRRRPLPPNPTGPISQEPHRHLDDGRVSAGSMLTSPSSALIDSSRTGYRSCTRRRPSLQQQGPPSTPQGSGKHGAAVRDVAPPTAAGAAFPAATGLCRPFAGLRFIPATAGTFLSC